MRNHLHIKREFGKESVILEWQWKHLVRKIKDYANHRRFSHRCLIAGITPLIISLNNMIRTLRSFDIIRKSEKQLLNKRIRAINNTIGVSSGRRHM